MVQSLVSLGALLGFNGPWQQWVGIVWCGVFLGTPAALVVVSLAGLALATRMFSYVPASGVYNIVELGNSCARQYLVLNVMVVWADGPCCGWASTGTCYTMFLHMYLDQVYITS